MCRLGIFSNLLHGVGAPLVGRQELIDSLGVTGRDGVLLSEVSLLNNRVRELSQSAHFPMMTLNKWVTYLEKLGGVSVKMISLSLGHDPSVQLSDLVVLASLTLVGPVTSSTDYVRGGLVRCLSDRLADERRCGRGRVGRLIAVWELPLSALLYLESCGKKMGEGLT